MHESKHIQCTYLYDISNNVCPVSLTDNFVIPGLFYTLPHSLPFLGIGQYCILSQITMKCVEF